MKSFRRELWFELSSRRGYVNITPDVETCIAESGVNVAPESVDLSGVIWLYGMNLTMSPRL